MKTIFAVAAAVMYLSGCATVTAWIPSFWDDNQSNYIVQAQVAADAIDCRNTQQPQVARVAHQLDLFMTYSRAKGSLQRDVIRVVEPLQKTVAEWQQRGEGSVAYCGIKRQLLIENTARASAVILGRW